MADPVVVTTFAFLHIVFAIAWLGVSFYLTFILGPKLRTLSPPAAMEFLAKVGTSTSRYAATVGGLTILFGLVLLYVVFGGDYTRWPLTMEVGFSTGFVAFLVGLVFTAPSLQKAAKIAKEFLKSPQQGPPPPEFLAIMKRGGISSTIATVILLFTAMLMVSTAFY